MPLHRISVIFPLLLRSWSRCIKGGANQNVSIRNLFAVLIVCSASLIAGCASAREPSVSMPQGVVKNAPWKRFSPAEANFSLVMPGVPTGTFDNFDSVAGPLEDRSFMLKAVQGQYKAAYMFSYVDYPKKQRGVLTDAEFLTLIFQSTQEENAGNMLYDKKIKFQNYEGIEYQYSGEIQKGHIVMGRNYLIDNRLLMLTAVMPKEQVERGDAAKYLDSLELSR